MEGKHMKKEIKTNVMRLLEREGVDYIAHEYPHGKEAVDGVTVASLLGQDPACVFKTLVTKGHSGGYFVFVVPVEKGHGICARRLFAAVHEEALSNGFPRERGQY